MKQTFILAMIMMMILAPATFGQAVGQYKDTDGDKHIVACTSVGCFDVDRGHEDEEHACWAAIKKAKKDHSFAEAHRLCDGLQDKHSREWYGKKLAKEEK